MRLDSDSRDLLQNLPSCIRDGIPGIWKCVGGLYSSSKGEGIACRKAEKKEQTLVRFEPGAGYSPPMKLLRGRRSEKERAPSIFASLFQAEAGWFMRSGCRGSAPRENSRFQLRTQPCRQGGGVCRCLLFFLRGAFLRREGRDASFSDDMQLPAIILFFFFFFFGPLPNVSAGGRLIIERPRADWVMYVSNERHADSCNLSETDPENWYDP